MSRIFQEQVKDGKFIPLRGIDVAEENGDLFINLGDAQIIASSLPEDILGKPLPKECRRLESAFFGVLDDGTCYVTLWSGNSTNIDCGVLIADVTSTATIEQRHRNNRRTPLKRDWPDSTGRRPVILEEGKVDEHTSRVVILFENGTTVRITDKLGERDYTWTGGPGKNEKRMHSTTRKFAAPVAA